MKLIVGLGNPGRKYEGTRHNVGFDVVAELVRRHGAGGAFKKAFQGETLDLNFPRPNGGSDRVLLLMPHTFMNASGQSAVAARDFYKLTNDDLLVVCDDLNLPVGKLRIRATGSSGGQKGLADIIRACGGENVPRLRIGIGQPPDRMQVPDFVLAKYGKDEKKEMELAVAWAADAAEMWVRDGVAVAMNRYN
jgi:PTH1 family peptidyl-tRNA hydrolase